MTARCPTCKQKLDPVARIRICGKCHQPIVLHDKWHFVFTGNQVQMRHRHCENPGSYVGVYQSSPRE